MKVACIRAHPELVPVLLMLLCTGLVVAAALYKRERWRTFAKEHNCQKVGKMDGDVVPSVGFDAKGTPVVTVGVTQDKTGWMCDDGMTYWK